MSYIHSMIESAFRKLNPAIVMLVISGFVLLSIFWGDSYRSLASLQDNMDDTREHNLELENQVSAMQERIAGIQSDPRKLEREAREQLLLSKDNELIFLFQSEKVQEDKAPK